MARRSSSAGTCLTVLGELIQLEGAASQLVSAVLRLRDCDFALVGGLAPMLRIDDEHRATADLDGVFDNPSDIPTTATLVATGVATPGDAVQRVAVLGVAVDVIDTFTLTDDQTSLPDAAKDRLFVCAHRYGYDTATGLDLSDGEATASIRVAEPPALVAMKSHALRYATPARRPAKRGSDLLDLYRLAALDPSEIVDTLTGAPWNVIGQVADALHEDIGDLQQAAAFLRSTPSGASVDGDRFVDVLDELLELLAPHRLARQSTT